MRNTIRKIKNISLRIRAMKQYGVYKADLFSDL